MNFGEGIKVFAGKGRLGLMALLLSLVIHGSLLAQDIRRVSGRIINVETQAPVPFASVGIPGRQIGTSADLSGFFELDLIPQQGQDSLIVSCVGYERYAIYVDDLSPTEMNIFQLKSKTTLLQEVIIREDPLNAEQIVLNAFKNLKEHLRTSPYLVGNRYREYIKVDGKYKGFTEATGILYMGGYNRNYNSFKNKSYTYDLAQWKHIRRSNYDVNLGNDRPDYLFVDKLIKTKDFFTYQGPIQKSQIPKLNYFLDSLTTYNDQWVYIVQFKAKEQFENEIKYEGSVLIKADDYAVLSLEIHDHFSEPIMGLNERKGISNNFNVFQIRYAQFEGKYYVSYLKQFNSYQVDVAGKPVKTEEVLEMVGGKFFQSKPQVLNYGQRTILFSEMENPVVIYDPGFWELSKLSDVPQIEALRRDLSQKEPLEKQFSDNSGKRIVAMPEGFKNYHELYLDQEAFDVFFPN